MKERDEYFVQRYKSTYVKIVGEWDYYLENKENFLNSLE